MSRKAVRVRSSGLSLTDKARTRRDCREASWSLEGSLQPTLGAQDDPQQDFCKKSPALPLLGLVQRELRPPHTPTGEHPRGGRDRGGEDFEYPTDVWLPGGFEDDHGNRPFGPLLVAGVALENRDDLGPELGPLRFGSDAGDHGASQACDRDAYLWIGPEVEVPCRVPVIAAERGHQHQTVAVDDRHRENRRACLTRPATDGDEFDEGHPEGSAEDPSLRDVEDRAVNTGAHL